MEHAIHLDSDWKYSLDLNFLFEFQVGEKPVEPATAGAAPKELFVALSSDRGLCGGIHSNICKTIRNELQTRDNIDNVGIICVGDKSRAQLSRYLFFVKLFKFTDLPIFSILHFSIRKFD